MEWKFDRKRRESKFMDGHYVAHMLVFKRMDRQWMADGKKSEDPLYHYTCKHFDGKRCGAYADRPHMCREFPSDRVCPYGCGYEEKSKESLEEKKA